MKLKIAQHSPRLDAVLHACGAAAGCFVTAYNPRSMVLCEAENAAATETLRHAVAITGLVYLPARALDPDGAWPPEIGFFILDMRRADAEALGARFDQNAIVYCVAGAAPELILLR